MVKASTVATVSAVTIATSFVAYAVYFDHKRRNDPQFRKQLRAQRRKADRLAQSSTPKTYDPDTITNKELDATLAEVAEEMAAFEATPYGDRHEIFLNKVGDGEALVQQGPSFYLKAASVFFQAANFYPVPREMISILERTQPPAVYGLVVRLLARDLETKSGGAIRGPGGRARSPPRGDAILEEIEPAKPAPKSVSSSDGEEKKDRQRELKEESPATRERPFANLSGRTVVDPAESRSSTASASGDSSPVAVSHASFDPTTPPVLVSVPSSEVGDAETLILSGTASEGSKSVGIAGSGASLDTSAVDLGAENLTEGVVKEDDAKVAAPGEGVGA